MFNGEQTMMEVNVSGKIEWRLIVGWGQDSYSRIGCDHVSHGPMLPQPQTFDNEEVHWVVGSMVPIIVLVK